MKSSSQTKSLTAGFGAVGIVAIVAVVAIIGALGYVFYQRSTQQKTASVQQAQVSSPVAAQPGTTASIDQLTQKDAATEASVDGSADAAATADATSSNAAVNNVGSSYDENSF